MAALIRVAIVDDHPATCAGLAAAMESADDLEFVGMASTLEDGDALLRHTQPEVALVDLRLEDGAEGLVLARRLDGAAGAPRILLYTSFDDAMLRVHAREAGVWDVVDKRTPLSDLLDIIRLAARGATRIVAAPKTSTNLLPLPSGREIEVIHLIAQGRSNDEIGACLGISARTAESHLRRLFARYECSSRAHLVAVAMRAGWLLAGPSTAPRDQRIGDQHS